jgi:hypothetical protein
MLSFPITLFIFILSIAFIYVIYKGTIYLSEKYKPMEDKALLGP